MARARADRDRRAGDASATDCGPAAARLLRDSGDDRRHAAVVAAHRPPAARRRAAVALRAARTSRSRSFAARPDRRAWDSPRSSPASRCSRRWRSWSPRSATRSTTGSDVCCRPTLYVRAGRRRYGVAHAGRPAASRGGRGVRRVEFLRVQNVVLDPALPRVAVLARSARRSGPAPAARRRCAASGARRAAGDLHIGSGARPVRLRAGATRRDSARGKERRVYRGRRVARLRAAAGRAGNRPRPLHRPHRRSRRQRCRGLARPGCVARRVPRRARSGVSGLRTAMR